MQCHWEPVNINMSVQDTSFQFFNGWFLHIFLSKLFYINYNTQYCYYYCLICKLTTFIMERREIIKQEIMRIKHKLIHKTLNDFEDLIWNEFGVAKRFPDIQYVFTETAVKSIIVRFNPLMDEYHQLRERAMKAALIRAEKQIDDELSNLSDGILNNATVRIR